MRPEGEPSAMYARIIQQWGRIRSSFWFVPAVMAVAAIALSYLTLLADELWPQTTRRLLHRVAVGDAEGLRTLLATVAGSMITITGVTFSITIVALSLASQQFGPRILTSFMRDRGNQTVLGTFIATFLFCLFVLRTVGREGAAPGESPFLPHLSVTVALLMVLMSLGVLIYFIHHAAASIQADNIIASIGRDLDHTIRLSFPDQPAAGSDRDPPHEPIPHHRFEHDAAPVTADNGGYIQAIDEASLIELASQHDLLIRMECRAGMFILPATPIALLHPAGRCDPAIERRVRRALIMGQTRTHAQDAEYAVNELVEIAVRALSPSTNDPFTAIRCIDRLTAALAHVQRRSPPQRVRCDQHRRPRLVVQAVDFRLMASAAFDTIRQHALTSTLVTLRLIDSIRLLAALGRSAGNRRVLRRHARLILSAARRALRDRHDRRDLARRVRHLLAALRAAPPTPGACPIGLSHPEAMMSLETEG